ncbi:MAG: hypothetical protein HeimC2_16220 [Candidatus Heimdallarchaeota archaeon LC_2]|nr:MAG: hypothetical protein HeimC2_16220 [Candidatus Heimdallarchaeota archaeon LC_2]
MKNRIPIINIINTSRPKIPEYGISKEDNGMVSWTHVGQWMDDSKNYWISTSKANGNPHARPIWGIWYENIFYFGGGQKTQNIKNLIKHPRIVVHTESGDNVVIIEGNAQRFDDDDLHQILGEKYKQRYKMFHPPPFWRVIPNTVFAWSMSDFANTPTRFDCAVV